MTPMLAVPFGPSRSGESARVTVGDPSAHPWRTMWLWTLLLLFPLACLALSLGIGRLAVPPDHVAGILLARWLPIEPRWTEIEARVVEFVRLPRSVLALLVGASLGMAGAALQGVLRNPLVGPQIVGVSSGAAFGGALAILLGAADAGVMAAAFLTGLGSVVVVHGLARVDGAARPLTLVLAGVVVSAFAGALTSLVSWLADPQSTLAAIVYWLMGSVAAASFDEVGLCATSAILGGGLLLLLAFRIDLLSLGDADAAALGVPIEPVRWAVLAAVALLVAGTVAVAGVVGWVGLAVPHLARFLVGPTHGRLLPASALLGGGFLLLVDCAARTLTAAELPLGMLTALVGAPVFALLLRRGVRAGSLA